MSKKGKMNEKHAKNGENWLKTGGKTTKTNSHPVKNWSKMQMWPKSEMAQFPASCTGFR